MFSEVCAKPCEVVWAYFPSLFMSQLGFQLGMAGVEL